MPIYEYECPLCGKFEAVQKVSDKPLKCNPDCTEKNCPKKAKRLISAAAFHLKGSGWYKTDYAGGKGATAGGTNASKTEAAKTDSGDGGSVGSTEKTNTEKSSTDSSGDGVKTKGGGKCGSGCGCH